MIIADLADRALKLKNKLWAEYKGSCKDPLLYLGLISLILFAALVSNGFSFRQSQPTASQEAIQSADNTFVTAGVKVKESPDLSLIQKNSLAAVSPPVMVTPQILGALIDSADYQWSEKEVTEYVVEPGDTLSSIADKFHISLSTVLGANNLSKNSVLKLGQKLVILPVSGVTHEVIKGDTLSGIAQTYKASLEKIIAFNDLISENDIYIGDLLIVPDGVLPAPVQYAPVLAPLADSYFICPIGSPCRITQGLHWYNAIDFSHGKCGDLIFAAAAGEVIKVKLTSSISKWAFGGAGNTISILHPNGVVTSYGHVQASLVKVGDRVSQGQIIALVGGALGMAGSGNSTGCHVHFAVSGARNPFSK